MKKLFLILALLFPISIFASITQNGTPDISTFNYPVTSQTFTHTVNVGSNTVLRVLVAWRTETGTPNATASVTAGGTAMNAVANTKGVATFPTNYEWDVQQFTLTHNQGLGTGSISIVVTITNSGSLMAGADSWDGVDQTTPAHNGTNDGTQSSSTPTLTVTSATGEIVLGGFNVVSGSATSTDNDQGDATVSGINSTGGFSYKTGSSSVTLGWSGTVLAGNWVLSGMSLNPSGGAPPTCPKTITLLGVGCDFSSLSLGSIPVNFNTSTNFTLSSDPTIGLFNYGPLANPIFRLFQDLGIAAKIDTTIATILNNYKILITDKLGNIIFP